MFRSIFFCEIKKRRKGRNRNNRERLIKLYYLNKEVGKGIRRKRTRTSTKIEQN